MTGSSDQTSAGRSASAWVLARRQHGVVTREQLVALGLSRHGIQHRIARGRLHPVGRGVYAVGRPELTRNGRLMAAVLVCGGEGRAAVSHSSAAALFKIGRERTGPIEVTRVDSGRVRVPGVRVHRRPALRVGWYGLYEGIPVTSPVHTLIDLAVREEVERVERLANEADKLGLVRTDELRAALGDHAGEPGVARLRGILDLRTFSFTRSKLESAFLPLVRRAGLPKPETAVYLNGHEVDFWFPELKLVVETDGLTYHRTPAQQARDRVRDQDHIAAGLIPLRFTHAQIKFDPDRVLRTLRARRPVG
jgi:very-short-patch-repair endonuclease